MLELVSDFCINKTVAVKQGTIMTATVIMTPCPLARLGHRVGLAPRQSQHLVFCASLMKAQVEAHGSSSHLVVKVPDDD